MNLALAVCLTKNPVLEQCVKKNPEYYTVYTPDTSDGMWATRLKTMKVIINSDSDYTGCVDVVAVWRIEN